MPRNSGMVISKTLDEKMTELINVLIEMNKNISMLVEKVAAEDGKKVQQKSMAKSKS